MAATDLCGLTAEQLGLRLRRREVSPIEATQDGKDHLISQLCAGYTVAANLAGLPAVPVPADLSGTDLPLGVQVMAGHFEELRALRVANAIIESAPELRRLRSPLAV